MFLPDHIVERGRPDIIGQWSVHSAPPVLRWRYYSCILPAWQPTALGRRHKMCYTAGEVKKMRTPEQVREILRALAQAYPAECSLQYQKDYELLFAVRLAAQCTDERVNQITPALVCALSDARGVCRRRAGGRRALCALVRVFPRKSAGHRAVCAQARRRIRRPRAGHDGGTHFPARRRAQDGEPHPRRCVPQARRGRGHALASGSQTGWDSSTGSRTPSRLRPRCARSCRRRNRPTFATGSSCTAALCAPRASRYAARAACATYVKPQRRWSYETDRTHPQ